MVAHRVDEQILKALDRKVWLPSGGSLVIDRTEAMTVVDVNTGKFTGSGGNLEETVTKNNLEAAEEIVRQLRLRDIGGIIVVDFIDMVLESNRDLVLRRLVECLGRDRTRHQVAEVTSLGLVQMTRKRIGTGLLESFSHDCPQCHGRGVVVEDAPVEPRKNEEEPRRARRGRSRGRGDDAGDSPAEPPKPPSPKDVAAMARHHDEHHDDDHADREDHEDHEDDTLEDLREADQEQLADSDVSAPELTMTTHDEATDTDETAAEQPAEGADDSLTLDEAERPDDDEPTVPDAPEAPEAPEATEVPEAVAPPAEPEKPRVVTRTRRRAASRPAGPPAPVEPSGASTDADGQATEGTPALHVPVKRKGTRKR
jgi:ribonuclease E